MSSELATVFELVELILLNLPPADVLRCQRVSRFWNAVIDSSSYLQSHLFFRSPPSAHAATATATSRPPPRPRPGHPVPRFLPPPDRPRANLLLAPRFFTVRPAPDRLCTLALSSTDLARIAALAEASPPSASWRRMRPLRDDRGFRVAFAPTESASVSLYFEGETTMETVVGAILSVREVTRAREARWKESVQKVLERSGPARMAGLEAAGRTGERTGRVGSADGRRLPP